MPDENKTPLTHRVTAVAAAYLDGIGCKPVETEVEIRPGWIADVASYWYPSHTEAKRLHLTKRARELLGVDVNREYELLPRTFGHGPFTVLIEVKTSVADFNRDQRKWQFNEPPAHICFIAFPSGIVTDIPKGWYGLETSKEGTRIRKVHRPNGVMHSQHPGIVLDFVAAVGIRRHHRTRYAAARDWLKNYRSEDREKKVRYSSGRLLKILAEWIQGKGFYSGRELLEALQAAGLKSCPKYADEAIAFFHTIKADYEQTTKWTPENDDAQEKGKRQPQNDQTSQEAG